MFSSLSYSYRCLLAFEISYTLFCLTFHTYLTHKDVLLLKCIEFLNVTQGRRHLSYS